MNSDQSLRRAERRYFTTMALVILASTIIGFAPSYYLRGSIPIGRPVEDMTLLTHAHGIIFSAWILLFVVQVGLVAAGRTDLHRRLGIVGMVLIAVMIPLAIIVAIGGVDRPLTAPPGIPPLSWLAVPLLDIPLFGGLIVAALANRKNPQPHKRLMLVAMIDMMQPSLGRMAFLGAYGSPAIVLACLGSLFIWDYRTTGRIHPATLWSSIAVVSVIIVTPLIWQTQAWLAFAQWVAGG